MKLCTIPVKTMMPFPDYDQKDQFAKQLLKRRNDQTFLLETYDQLSSCLLFRRNED